MIELPRCAGKIGYPTRSDASSALGKVRRRRGEGLGLGVYHCAHCGGFHLGRDPKRAPPMERYPFDKGAKVRRYWQLVREG